MPTNRPPYRTYREYLADPRFKAIRAVVMERAGGICEDCGRRPATEPHHLRYPPWGTFDVPENMVAVCHRCHSRRHGKDD
jgi:HNH endonuclease